MKLKHLYLILAILGFIIPYTAFWPYLSQYDFDIVDFIQQGFATPTNAFLSWDLLLVVFALFVFIISESKKLSIKHFWIPLVCIIFVNAAFGFPLFLYMRELQLEKLKKTS